MYMSNILKEKCNISNNFNQTCNNVFKNINRMLQCVRGLMQVGVKKSFELNRMLKYTQSRVKTVTGEGSH